jgi:hypothetical protein
VKEKRKGDEHSPPVVAKVGDDQYGDDGEPARIGDVPNSKPP